MAMRSSDFPELLDTPLRKIFFLSLENSRPEYQRWINIVETKRAFEDDLRMAEFGSIPQHTEGSTPLFEDAIEGQRRGTLRWSMWVVTLSPRCSERTSFTGLWAG